MRPFGARILGALALFLAAPFAAAQDDDDDLPQFRPGLVAHYSGQGKSCDRLDDRLHFDWADSPPDARIPAGLFRGRWQGHLRVLRPGKYRFHVFLAGKVRLALAKQDILEAGPRPAAEDDDAAAGKWYSSAEIDVPFGYQPIAVDYEKTGRRGQLVVCWEGPGFQLEPLAPQWLFHQAEQRIDDRFERGQQLVHALRCGACHTLGDPAPVLKGPALDRLAENVNPAWLASWLESSASHYKQGDADGELVRARRMPDFDLNRADSVAIAAFLLNRTRQSARPGAKPDAPAKKPAAAKPSAKKPTDKKPTRKKPKIDPARGRRLVQSLGCLACHELDAGGTAGLFSGGDLSAIAGKRPVPFFERWLKDPVRVNKHHRMPIFALSAAERADVSAYLATRHGNADRSAKVRSARQQAAIAAASKDATALERGRLLVGQLRCAACHELGGEAPPAQPPIRLARSGSSWVDTCLSAPAATKGDNNNVAARPGYRLNKNDSAAVVAYLSAAAAPQHTRGALVLAERNCLACHARDHAEGLKAKLTGIVAGNDALALRLPALAPPALNGVGDKLHESALAAAITTKVGRLRPWLDVRMPRFTLSDEETASLVQHFIASDRVPDGAPTPLPKQSTTGATTGGVSAPDERAHMVAGSRLVTAAGFGCTSCHQIGAAKPVKVALNAHGSDLSLVGKRIRRTWFDRWVRNPARIVPRMEMPSIKLAIPGVLEGHLDQQLAAVWHVLNVPDFNPPPPGAVRVVRARNDGDIHARARIITDGCESGQLAFVKPLIVGLPNRHNLLISLEHNALTGWWIGDTAQLRTRGKTWFWEPGQNHLFPLAHSASEVALVRGDRELAPHVSGQFPTEIDELDYVERGIRFRYRLKFASQGSSPIEVRLTQTIQALANGADPSKSGFLRRFRFENLPSGAAVRLAALPLAKQAGQRSADGRTFQLTSPLGTHRIELRGPGKQAFAETGPSLILGPARDAVLEVDLAYRTDAPVDQYLAKAKLVASPPLTPLDVVPGFAAVQLPLDGEMMPTALAWRKDGTLAVASLKGRVWMAHDTDGDGCEDRIAPFCDDLACPYGLAASGNSVDVLTKAALLRLYDEDSDGRAERIRTLVSGWGHTRDYHDWAVGLRTSRGGGYFMALPCQQDERSPAAGHLRGQALLLSPRRPDAANPHAFSIRTWSAGLRFPMGLAVNRRGDLFATDNQGNYNPFNELNHLRSGKRYGFINRLEAKPGFKPPLAPPAIDIPHPWTRSVNGICFLDTPTGLPPRFGPFEGHLVGCEYDTRRLVRFSLQRIGDTYQGAAYPFSRTPASGSEGLQGPLVCEVSPQGELYVGNIRDSGWGGGNNIGSIVKLRPSGQWPAGLAEVKAIRNGFELAFTQPLDAKQAAQASSYTVESFRRISTPAYGGKDQDRRSERVRQVAVSDDLRRVRLTFAAQREGYVYEFRIDPNLANGEAPLFPAEAYYTLRKVIDD